jgi:hypothetical protein
MGSPAGGWGGREGGRVKGGGGAGLPSMLLSKMHGEKLHRGGGGRRILQVIGVWCRVRQTGDSRHDGG